MKYFYGNGENKMDVTDQVTDSIQAIMLRPGDLFRLFDNNHYFPYPSALSLFFHSHLVTTVDERDRVRIGDNVHFFYGPDSSCPMRNEEVTLLVTDEFLDKRLEPHDLNAFLGDPYYCQFKRLYLVRNSRIFASFIENYHITGLLSQCIRLRLYLPSFNPHIRCFYGSDPIPEKNQQIILKDLDSISCDNEIGSLFLMNNERLITVFHSHHRPRISNTVATFLTNHELPSPIIATPSLPSPSRSTLGFIMIRHVRCADTNRYWLHAIECIRRFHRHEKILIIDDGSNMNKVNAGDACLDGCHVISSEYPGAAEILPYYYFHKTRLFDVAYIMHDSLFIQQPVDPSCVKSVRFLWEFGGDGYLDFFPEYGINAIQNILDCDETTRESLSHKFQSLDFLGCFGAMSMIRLDFMDLLVSRYNFLELVPHIADYKKGDRLARMSFERFFACLCSHQQENDPEPSLYGSIFTHVSPFMFLYHNYTAMRQDPKRPSQPAFKVWSGR
jgi:hypothetical protein